jgi:hypothetical protein
MTTTFKVHHNEHVSSRSFEEVVSAFESAVGFVEDTGFPVLLAATKSGEEFESRVKSREATRLEVKPVENLLLRVAILDGVPVERPTGWDVFGEGDGLLIVSEAAFLYRPSNGEQPRPQSRRFLIGRNSGLPPYEAKLAVGIWQYTASFPDLSERRADGTPAPHDGSTGGYLIGETIFYRDEANREMRVFGELSLAASGFFSQEESPPKVSSPIGLTMSSGAASWRRAMEIII